MNALSTLPSASRGRLVADLYMASVRDHKFVCLEGPDGADREAVLDRFAAELVAPRTCLLRIQGTGLAELGLTQLTDQLALLAPDDGSDEDGRVLAFTVLTDAAGQQDRIVLIVDGAQRLTPAAARLLTWLASIAGGCAWCWRVYPVCSRCRDSTGWKGWRGA